MQILKFDIVASSPSFACPPPELPGELVRRLGIEQLGTLFGSIFSLFLVKVDGVWEIPYHWPLVTVLQETVARIEVKIMITSSFKCQYISVLMITITKF